MEAFKLYLEEQEKDLEVLRRVVNAAKHQIAGKSGDEQYTATGVTKVTEDALVIENDGRPVIDVLGSAMAFWRQWLEDHP